MDTAESVAGTPVSLLVVAWANRPASFPWSAARCVCVVFPRSFASPSPFFPPVFHPSVSVAVVAGVILGGRAVGSLKVVWLSHDSRIQHSAAHGAASQRRESERCEKRQRREDQRSAGVMGRADSPGAVCSALSIKPLTSLCRTIPALGRIFPPLATAATTRAPCPAHRISV